MRLPEIHVKKQGKNYHYYFLWKGEQQRGTCKTPNRVEARKYAEKAMLDLIGSKDKAFYKSPTELFEEYEAHLIKLGRSQETIKNYQRYAHRFSAYRGFVNKLRFLPELTRQDIQGWIDWLAVQKVGDIYGMLRFNWSEERLSEATWDTYPNLSSKTIHEHICWLSSIFKFHGFDNPCMQLIRPRSQKFHVEKMKAYNADEVRKMLKEAEKERTRKRTGRARFAADTPEAFYHWHYLYIHTGCRLGELQFLPMKNIDREGKSILVLSSKTKKYRRLNLSNISLWSHVEALIEMAKTHYGKDALEPDDNIHYRAYSWFYKTFVSFCERHKIEWKGDHGTRHAFATQALLRMDWSIERLALHLGHDRNTCFNTYIHLMNQETPEFSYDE